MNGNHLVELFEGIVFHRHHGAIVAGVIHEDIDAAEFLSRGGDHTSAVGFVREVRGNKGGLPAGCSNFLSGGSQLRFRSRG